VLAQSFEAESYIQIADSPALPQNKQAQMQTIFERCQCLERWKKIELEYFRPLHFRHFSPACHSRL
jgi:hypothetical protein